ncbi:uncharacterized protein LOC110696187 [Chenopodium quinoa]|uniref:uncharacterized protein LOC110696187 n=1 Tax=Chenopodium quinoa TaxID=63459 RepID=UPI000B78BB3D|nr:uncharacterized protein LOC110696187 [Chenopodium quinoa]
MEFVMQSDSDEDSEGEVAPKGDVPADELVQLQRIPKIKDNWKPGKWFEFLDDEDDEDYFKRLYKNGEMYEDADFGKIVLRPWMIFTDKAHFKDTLKDFAVQERFAINVEYADNKRYTAVCQSQCCDWRLHASRLSDGRTWAIKKIWPNVHTCIGLETYNPICNVKWASQKVMEDIRANPDIPGKALIELLFQRYGIYMRQSTLYRLKCYVIEQLFGGHDESYSLLPMYAKMCIETNPETLAFCAWQETESLPKQLQFTNGNNEIFPIAYAIVSQEDKESWSYFFWHLRNMIKESSREHWTIISDRQKGVELALDNVWPEADRRFCCRHLSRNYKKKFPGPMMYVLFWRACNATSAFTFRKAMEKLKKEGGDDVMCWFAYLGEQSKWTKHKFSPNVCNETNTSNFVESFNSTLGVNRCRPVLTLLEGIRRVCMIGKASSNCRAFKSSPGEYEIHEGRSQFPLSLNKKICSCGAWQLSGVPCRHAIRALIDAKLDPHDFVSSWYSVKTYKQAYSTCINPIPDTDQWPIDDSGRIIMPPKMKRGIGRPSRNRKREEGEVQPGKRSKTVKCSKCGCFGHNKATCKGGLTGKELKASEPVVIKNPRVRDQSNAAKAAKAANEALSDAAASKSRKKGKQVTDYPTELNASQLPSQPANLSQAYSDSPSF